MDTIYIGLLITFGACLFFWGWVLKMWREDPKTKREKFKEALDEYRENIRKLYREEDDIDEIIEELEGRFTSFEHIKQTNKKLRKSIKKHKL